MKLPILRKRLKNVFFQKRGVEPYHALNSISWAAALRPLLLCLKIAMQTNIHQDKRHFNALLTNFKTERASKEYEKRT